MKSSYLLFCIAVIFLGVILGFVVPIDFREKTGIVFEEENIDMGAVERDSVVTSKFEFKNHFKQPVWIQSITKSCGCLLPEFSTEEIAPNECGKILVALNSGQGSGERNQSIEKKLTIKFAPIGLEKTVSIRATPLEDLKIDPSVATFSAMSRATNRVRIERGFLSMDDFKGLEAVSRGKGRVILVNREPDLVELYVDYDNAKYDQSDSIVLKYRKGGKEFVKTAAIGQSKAEVLDINPINYFIRIPKDISLTELGEKSLVKFAVHNMDDVGVVSKVFFEEVEIGRYFDCKLGRPGKNEFSISMGSLPEKSIVGEATVEFARINGVKDIAYRLPVRVLVQKDDF